MSIRGVSHLMVPVAAATSFLGGAYVCFNTSGQAAVPANTTGFVYAGTAMQDVDNSAGAAADKYVPVQPPSDEFRFISVTLASAAQGDCGEEAYFTATATVSKTAGNGCKAGTIVALLGTDLVLVDTMRHAA